MVAAALRVIAGLYRALVRQKKVVHDQEASIEFLHQANTLLDVERLTGITMEEETENLATARGILDDLNAQLGWAIASWKQMGSPQALGPATPQPPAEHSTSSTQTNKNAPGPDGYAAGTQAGYAQQWNNWTEAPTMHSPTTLNLSQPTRWWMQQEDHYGLCQPPEQDQLESSARAAQFNRAYTPTARSHPSPHKVRQAQVRQFHPSALPLPPAMEANLSHGRRVRAGSEDFWLDDDYDPDFWQKNIQRGTLWFGSPRFPIAEEAPVSPGTVPQQLGGRKSACSHS